MRKAQKELARARHGVLRILRAACKSESHGVRKAAAAGKSEAYQAGLLPAGYFLNDMGADTMTVVQIATFSDALLYALQQRILEGYEPRLTFQRLWSICFACALQLYHLHSTFDRGEIIRLMFISIDDLQQMGYIRKLMNGKMLHSITLTDEGVQSIKQLVFAGQENLNKNAWE